MKTTVSMFVCLVCVSLLSGCKPQYRALATVRVERAGGETSQSIIDSEVQALRGIAPAFVSADERYAVKHHAHTTLINVSVTTPDPEDSASQCNRIVETYVGMTNAPVVRRIVERAVVPERPL